MSIKAFLLLNKIAEMKDDIMIDKIICAAINEGIDINSDDIEDNIITNNDEDKYITITL